MSFPPGTEMFQFSGFASIAYVFSVKYLTSEMKDNGLTEVSQ